MTAPEPDRFPYGVASFDPTDSAVLLWTRTDGSCPLDWEVALDLDFAKVVASGQVPAARDTPAGAEASHVVDVDGLVPGTSYYYRFSAKGSSSPIGRSRTLPDATSSSEPFRLGLACCADLSAGHFGVYRALAEADVDAVVHLGDYIYADPEGDEREVDPPEAVFTGAGYRARYQQARRDPDLAALHQSHAMFVVIDDHDLTDNAWDGGAPNHDPETQGRWPERRDAAVAERAAWLPIRGDRHRRDGHRTEWRSASIGSLADLVLLDTRLAGRTAPATDDGPDLCAPGRSILGSDQLSWARERIVDRTRPWCLVVSSVVMDPMEIPFPKRLGRAADMPAGFLATDEGAVNSDAWDGYPAERNELVASMRERGSGVVVLSGDVHSSWAWEGPRDADGPVAVEMTCPAATSPPMGEVMPVVSRVAGDLVAGESEARWTDLDGHGFVVVEVAAATVTGTWWFCGRADLPADADCQAGWATDLDVPGVLYRVDGEADLADADDTADRATPPLPHLPERPRPLVRHAARRRRRRRTGLAAALAAAAILVIRRRDIRRTTHRVWRHDGPRVVRRVRQTVESSFGSSSHLRTR